MLVRSRFHINRDPVKQWRICRQTGILWRETAIGNLANTSERS